MPDGFDRRTGGALPGFLVGRFILTGWPQMPESRVKPGMQAILTGVTAGAVCLQPPLGRTVQTIVLFVVPAW